MKRGLFILFLAMLAGSLSAQYLQHRRAAFRGGGAFSPSDISGMIAWYAADDISSSDGTEQTTWSDLSGNGYTLTANSGTGPTWETGEVNGLPAMLFNGTTDFMTNSSIPALIEGTDVPITIFAVTKNVDVVGTQSIVAGTDTAASSALWEFDTTGDTLRFAIRDDAATLLTIEQSNLASTTAFQIKTLSTTGTAGDLYADGTNYVSAGNVNVGSISIDRFSVGARWTSGGHSFYMDGYIAELIIYDSALSAGDVALVHGYLSDKYAITIP